MFSSSYEYFKENAPRSAGCGCGCVPNRVRSQQIHGLQPLAANSLRPTIYHSTAIKDYRLAGNMCGYSTQRPRSKSSNEENMHRIAVAASYQQTSSVAKSINQSVVSYNHMVQREIQELLQEDRGPVTSTVKAYRTLTRPSVYVTSDNYSNNALQREARPNSAQLVLPPQARRHSCSSLTKEEQEFNEMKDRFQRSYGEYRRQKGYASGTDIDETLTNQTADNAIIFHKTESVAENENISEKIFSPVLPNRFTNINTLISNMPGQIREPKLKKRASKYLYDSVYVGDIYNEEYLPEIIQYMRYQAPKIILDPSFLNRFNPQVERRMGVLNWVLTQQSFLNFTETEYYLAVSLMDHVLASTKIPMNMYQLIILGSLWIAMKLLGSVLVKASHMVRVCNGAYLAEQLTDMERKILKIIDYKMHTTEPSLTVNYFLKLLKMSNDTHVNATICYILESFSMTSYFSSTPVVVLGAACVKYTFTHYFEGEVKILYILDRILNDPEMEQMYHVEKLIHMQMKNMVTREYQFRQPYHKYRLKERGIEASQTFAY